MDYKYKIGDIIILTDAGDVNSMNFSFKLKNGSIGEITHTSYGINYGKYFPVYMIKFESIKKPIFIPEERIELNKKYYREIKLNNLLS